MIANSPITGLLIGMFVSAVLVITFRRKTHKAIELAAWIGLVGTCAAAVIGVRDPQVHAMTTSAAWGTSQVLGTIGGAFKVDALRWTYGERFVIADWVVLLLGADVLALALVSTNRQAGSRVPANKLREWWVLPRLPGARSARPNVASATDEINRWFNSWSAAAALSAAMWSTLFLIWLRDVEIPSTAGGLWKRGFRVLAVLRRSGTGRTNATTSSLADRAVIAPRTRPSQRATSTAAARGSGRANTVSARGRSAARRADRRKGTNGSKKRRQSRLAS